MKKLGNIIWGIVLVVIGLLFAYNAMFDPDINIFFDGWWTLFIIVPCFVGLVQGNDIKGNLIGIAIGAALMLACLDVIDFSLIWKLIIPVVLIVVGASIIFKDSIKTKVNKEIKRINDRNKESNNKNASHCAAFSGLDLDFSGEDFKGTDLTAVFGGIDCDISRSIINEDIVINAEAIFGGVDIIVPPDVNVKIKSTSIFGGASKGKKADVENAPTVYVNATCIFGGVEVK